MRWSNVSDSNEFRMHGTIGIRPDGRPHFSYSDPPRQPYNIAEELKGNGFFVRLSDRCVLNHHATSPPLVRV